MTPHPCRDHLATCDHCFLCDVVGVCCGSVSAAERARLEAEHQARPYDGLASLVLAEACLVDRPSLRGLIQHEAEHPSDAPPPVGLLLPAVELPAGALVAPLSTPIRKEPHGIASRTDQQ